MTNEEKLSAIASRLRGDFDDPALIKFGPLSVSVESDVLAIISHPSTPEPPLRVLVTVGRGDRGEAYAEVDYLSEGVTVEVRNFDTETGEPFGLEYESDPDGKLPGTSMVRDVELVRVPDEDDSDTYRRADNARPEFDGEPDEG